MNKIPTQSQAKKLLRAHGLRMRAHCRHEHTGDYHAVLEITPPRGEMCRTYPLLSELQDRRHMPAKLVNKGVRLQISSTEANQLIDALAAIDVPRGGLLVGRNGWHRETYFLDQRRFGCRRREHIYRDESKAVNKAHAKKGSFKKWREEVAKPAEKSPIMMFAIAAALTGPALKLTSSEGGLFHFHGPSKSGKTTTLALAQSVIRSGERGDLTSWDITDRRLDELLDAYSDGLIVLDELARLQGKPTDRYLKLRDAVFRLGTGVARARSLDYGLDGRDLGGQVVVLSAGEEAYLDLCREAKSVPLRGQLHRAIDIPIVEGMISARYPGKGASKAPSELPLNHIAASAAKNYGHAFPRFIRALTDDLDDSRETLEKFKMAFIKKVGASGSGWNESYARRFATVYAAGRFAIRKGLLPWDKDAFRAGVISLYTAAHTSLPDHEASLKTALKRLRKHLRGGRRMLRAEGGSSFDQGALGYFIEDEVHGPIAALSPHEVEKFVEWPVSLADIHDRLESEGLLLRGNDGKAHRQIRIGKSRPRLLCVKRAFYRKPK